MQIQRRVAFTGAGDLQLGVDPTITMFGALVGYGVDVNYVLQGEAGDQLETGIGQLFVGGAFTRVTVTSSTSGGKVPFSPGMHQLLLDSRPAGGASDGIIGCTFDGQGSPLGVGSKAFVTVPYACTITEVIALADTAGDVVVDVWRDSYANFPPVNADSITGSSPVTIVGTDKSTDAVLAGWSPALNAGDVLCFHVDSCSSITKLYIQLKAIK